MFLKKRKGPPASFQVKKCVVPDDMHLDSVGNHMQKIISNYRRLLLVRGSKKEATATTLADGYNKMQMQNAIRGFLETFNMRIEALPTDHLEQKNDLEIFAFPVLEKEHLESPVLEVSVTTLQGAAVSAVRCSPEDTILLPGKAAYTHLMGFKSRELAG
ncbi:hypothetical protein TNCV_1617961 [Trichonephila clavipes]|nr:hypothetical protein TNCV_1617961 [Trichonephila clavipes]